MIALLLALVAAPDCLEIVPTASTSTSVKFVTLREHELNRWAARLEAVAKGYQKETRDCRAKLAACPAPQRPSDRAPAWLVLLAASVGASIGGAIGTLGSNHAVIIGGAIGSVALGSVAAIVF